MLPPTLWYIILISSVHPWFRRWLQSLSLSLSRSLSLNLSLWWSLRSTACPHRHLWGKSHPHHSQGRRHQYLHYLENIRIRWDICCLLFLGWGGRLTDMLIVFVSIVRQYMTMWQVWYDWRDVPAYIYITY